jgi:hypothetical protein
MEFPRNHMTNISVTCRTDLHNKFSFVLHCTDEWVITLHQLYHTDLILSSDSSSRGQIPQQRPKPCRRSSAENATPTLQAPEAYAAPTSLARQNLLYYDTVAVRVRPAYQPWCSWLYKYRGSEHIFSGAWWFGSCTGKKKPCGRRANPTAQNSRDMLLKSD